MSLDDWILALHILSAFALVAATVLFWILIVAIRNLDAPGPTLGLGRVAMIGNITVNVGTLGTIVFGIWLAISLDAYQVWDGWILAAIVLWMIGSGAGGGVGREYRRSLTRAQELETAGGRGPSDELLALNRTPRGVLFHAVSTLATTLILVDMIWKPGA